jgi:tRNA(adenine34) deaminase
MQVFFKARRSNLAPLRQDALRTPQACFENLPNFPWPANFADDLPSLGGLRLHFVDEGARDALTFLCLHDSTSWSYAYRDALPIWVDAGQRVVLPDLIGFGKSDKPKKEATHTFNLHLQSLQALVAQLDLQRIVLVLPDAKDALGLSLPMTDPSRYVGLLTLDDTAQTDADLNDPALAAPFPDKGHGSAIKPVLAMRQSALSTDVADFWQRLWHGRRLDLNLSAHAQGAAIAKESLKFFQPSIS